MSLVLSPSDGGLLRKVLTNNLVAMTPDTKSTQDFNGNQTDRRKHSSPNGDLLILAPPTLATPPPPPHPLSQSPGIILQSNSGSMSFGHSSARPNTGMAQTSSATTPSASNLTSSNNNNHSKAPIFNSTAPMLNATAPVLNSTAPILNAAAPILNSTAPRLNSTTPILNSTTPIVAYKASISNATVPNLNSTAPILNLAKTEQPATSNSFPSNISARDQMNKNCFSSPLSSLAKIDESRPFAITNRTFQACSPAEDGGTAITITTATPETKTDAGAVEPVGAFPRSSTPTSKKPREASICSDPRKSFKSPIIRRSDITFGRCIGKGGFGTVHEGTIAGRPVAIKVVKKRRGSGIHREILQAERLAYRLNLRHGNIVAILGVNMCDDLRGDALIVMELVTSRSLQELLSDVSRPLHRRERFRFATEIASALHYLHSNDVAHLDVKPANVLMTSESVCKLTDFGSLTRTGPNVAREEVEYTQLLGTLPYRAPELMQGLFPSTKADLYSYGIVLWQMVTREQPHRNANPHSLIYQVVKWNIRPNVPDPGADEMDILYTNLYTSCWDGAADVRPCAGKVVEILDSIQHRIS